MKSASASSASDIACTPDEALLYNNLCLLGLADISKLSTAGIELGRFTFRKPSSKALEYVLFHCFCAMNTDARAIKSQQSEFHQKIADFFKSLKDSNQLEGSGLTTTSQLRSASGARLINTLLDLTSLALNSEYKRLLASGTTSGWDADAWAAASGPWRFKLPTDKEAKTIPVELAQVMSNVSKANIALHAREFSEVVHAAGARQNGNDILCRALTARNTTAE
eukprot:gene20604-27403_t